MVTKQASFEETRPVFFYKKETSWGPVRPYFPPLDIA